MFQAARWMGVAVWDCLGVPGSEIADKGAIIARAKVMRMIEIEVAEAKVTNGN